MPLYDVTHYPPRLVNPEDAENYDVLQMINRNTHPATWKRTVKTFAEAIEELSRFKDFKLVWTKVAAIFGYSAMGPKKLIDNAWQAVNDAVGEDDVMTRKGMGGLLRWQVSLREEIWFVYREDSGEVDKLTGKKITVSTYWISEKLPDGYEPKRKKNLDVHKLSVAWGATLR
jgi:hypothetical protein